MNESVAVNLYNPPVPTVKDNSHRSVFIPIIVDYKNQKIERLSLKEKLVCDTWIQTQSYEACSNAIKEKFGISIRKESIKKWMTRSDVIQSHLANKLKDLGFFNNWTRERFIRCAEALAQGKPNFTFDDGQVWDFDKGSHFKLKLLGDALGYNQEARKGLQNNIQINFTQADGRI